MRRQVSKKRKTKGTMPGADHGTIEARKHGTFVEVDTQVAGVKALRNVTADPLATYLKRGQITPDQFQSGDLFAQHFDRAKMGPRYALMQLGQDNVGQGSLGAQEGLERARQEVKTAMDFVGIPLAYILQHVIGHGHLASSWSGVGESKRKSEDGLAALRLALDGLKKYYKL